MVTAGRQTQELGAEERKKKKESHKHAQAFSWILNCQICTVSGMCAAHCTGADRQVALKQKTSLPIF